MSQWKSIPKNGVSIKRKDEESLSNLETLRASVEWVVGEGMFKHLPGHRNTTWLAVAFVMLAVL